MTAEQQAITDVGRSYSGIPWIRIVPTSWTLKKMKYVSRLVNGYAFDSKEYVDEGVPIIRIGDVQTPISIANAKRVPFHYLKVMPWLQVKMGDILLAMTGATIGKSAVFVLEEATLLNQRVGILRATKMSQRFLARCVESDAVRTVIDLKCYGGAQENIGKEELGNITLALPPAHSDQERICDFLDAKTAQIDALIAKKQRLIELLQEKRTALISHAVTKGLNPNAEMKDSGVEWLGKIPKHWDVWKTAHAFETIGSGTTPKSDKTEYYEQGEIPWVTTAELRESVIVDTEKRVTKDALREHSALKLYKVGSVLMAMYGATVGRLGLLGVAATTNQACCVFQGGKQISEKFLYYWLRMRRPVLIAMSVGGGQPNLSQDDLKNLRVPCPSLSEQKDIVEFLAIKTTELDSIIDKTNKGLDLLIEYRSALISSAVTGQLPIN